MADTANKYAADYPDTAFYFIDLGTSYEFASSENTVGMAYKQNEGMFLTGALAGLMSKTGNIGFIGGIENIIINDFGTGYIAGATHVNPNIKIQFSYVGNFNDSAKAKELAGIQANLGADVIHNVAGIAGLGVLEGAQKAGIMALGVDNDQSKGFEETNPELSKVIMTSMVKDWGQVIYNFAVRYIENPDSITYGEIERLGLKEGAVRLAKNEVYEETVPADIREKIDTLEKDIIDEKLQIPSAFDHTDAEWQELKASVALQ
jgi:basic membrane protein A